MVPVKQWAGKGNSTKHTFDLGFALHSHPRIEYLPHLSLLTSRQRQGIA